MGKSHRETVRQLCKVTLLHRYRISTSLLGLNIYRGQPEILDYLIAHGDCSQRELADFLGVSPASIATSLKRMCKAGLVERTADEKDRRINRLRITEKGEEIRKSCRLLCEEVDKEMFSGFSQEEILNFSHMLERIYDNLSGGSINEKDVINYIKNEPKGDDNDD